MALGLRIRARDAARVSSRIVCSPALLASLLVLFASTGRTPTPAWASQGEVGVTEIEPWYGPEWPDGSTSRTPSLAAILVDESGDGIHDIELLFDDEVWAFWFGPGGNADFIRGNGEGTVLRDDQDPTRYALEYRHSTAPRDWLAFGDHVLTIRFETESGKSVELSPDAPWARFEVSRNVSSIR